MAGAMIPSTTGLTLRVYGARYYVDGDIVEVPDGDLVQTFTLTDDSTNYLELAPEGTMSIATSATGATRYVLASFVVADGAITSSVDYRDPHKMARFMSDVATVAMGDANHTCTLAEILADVIVCTGTNTAVRNLVVPNDARTYTVHANTVTNGVQVIGTSGTGVTVGIGKHAVVRFDGTNVVRVTADT
jgi:hypothetical protein